MEGEGQIVFYPVKGDPCDEFLGTLPMVSGTEFELTPQSLHIKLKRVSPVQYDLYFYRGGFRILQYDLTADRLAICFDIPYPSSPGDKLCSFHGQKGVMKHESQLPVVDGNVELDLVINPYGLFRMTVGQIMECLVEGGGHDSPTVEIHGNILHNPIFFCKVFYFLVAYFSLEHIYTPHEKDNCGDKVFSQPLKGRNRNGGTRLGYMENLNGLRGNGVVACFQTKFYENGDGIVDENMTPIPKSTSVCIQDAMVYKTDMRYSVEERIQIV